MNALNLRVSTVKTGDNVRKNAEMRAALITLPKKYKDSTQHYCLAFKNAKVIPEQVNIVKDIFKTLGSDPDALQFLGDLFFYSPLKHPVRNQILKILITAARLGTGGIDESQIVAALNRSQVQLLEDTKSETESTKFNFAVNSLATCFDNFACGLKAFEQNLETIFLFLCASVQKYLTELGVLSSPSVRNDYYLYIHSSVRCLLSCMQDFPQKLRDIQNGEQLRQLNQLCRQLIVDDDMPMDARTNAGILIAHIAKIFDEYEKLLEEVKQTKNANEIALCVGIVNTCSQQDFLRNSADLRDVCGKIDEIANANATVPQILLCAARALYQISKLILSLELKLTNTASVSSTTTTSTASLASITHCYEAINSSSSTSSISSSSNNSSSSVVDDAKLILRKLLIFAFGYLEHHMDSVRHICRDLLRNIVAAAKKIKFDFLQKKIFDACNSERLSLSMKCVVLQQMAAILGAGLVIENCPELFEKLFALHLGRDFIVNNLYEVLMSASHKELNYEAWFDQWIEYLLKIAAANDARLADIEILIVKAVKCEPKIVQKIVDLDAATTTTTKTHLVPPISTKLSALWAVRKSGIQMQNFNEIMQKFSAHLTHSILTNSDETRIMALRLLVETHKTTETLSQIECAQLLAYLDYNVNCQCPATRQKSLGLLSKALLRCELNLAKILKEVKFRMATNQPQQQQPLQLIFLLEFMRLLVENLFRGANFSRRSLSLQLLEQAVRVCINLNIDLNQALPPQTVAVLTATIDDSYEANKELAVNILKLIEAKLDCKLIEQHKLSINLTEIHNLLTSVRPTDSVTAAYQLDFYCHRTEAQKFGDFELPSYEQTQYAALKWLLLSLRDGLKIAKSSLLQAAKLNPLYGLLFAVRHLLQRLDFQILAQQLIWRILIAEMIVVCKELTTVVAPVVNSSSPEGHLPNDFSALPAQFAAENEDGATTSTTATDNSHKILSQRKRKLNVHAIKTTPQMVLLCAWRTVKEVSLILGEIVLRSPLQYNKLTEQFLITKEQILEIGEHFKLLLSETKHRGAFEQAYVGFSKLCCRLWRVESIELNSLPLQWLRELITLISRDEQINEKICATRRSAGVPFMVQALITSELQVGSTKALYFCMSHLLQLCGGGGGGSGSTESHTHALNILRALFRCTELNETVGEFVADGIICSIRAYDASTWSVRNSATLLFAALITRIFGVQRTKDSDNLNIRNKMTGRIFFLRYPKLYDFFLEQLKHASDLVRVKQKAHKLHPLLLILSRLYPSALEGTESNLKLSADNRHRFSEEAMKTMQEEMSSASSTRSSLPPQSTSIKQEGVPPLTLINPRSTAPSLVTRTSASNLQQQYFGEGTPPSCTAKNKYQAFGEYISVELQSLPEYKAEYVKRKLNRSLLDLMEEVDSMLSEFVPHIMACAGCAEMQTRYLAAKAVTALVSKDAVSVTILRKCATILISADDLENFQLNKLHADLLQLLFLLKVHKTNDTELIGDIAGTLVTLHEHTRRENAVILKVILDILIQILQSLSSLSTYTQATKTDLLYFATQKQFYAANLSFIYPVFRKSFFIYNLHTLRLTLPFGAISDYLLNPIVSAQTSLEETETRLNIILLILLNKQKNLHTDQNILSEIEILPNEAQFVQSLDSETVIELAAELRQSRSLEVELKELLSKKLFYPECVMKAYAILSLLDHFDMTLSNLIKECKHQTGDVKSMLALCVERSVLKQGVENKVSQLCLEYLMEIAQPWQPDCLRIKASRILSHIAVHYRKSIEKKKMQFVRLYIGLTLSLLMDDDYEIRDNTTRIVIRNLADNIEMESVVPTMAQRLFLQSTADVLRQMKADDAYILDIFKMITETLTIASSNSDSDDSGNSSTSSGVGNGNAAGGGLQNCFNLNSNSLNLSNDIEVFDKNEANIFAEPTKAIMDCIVIFKHTFNERSKVVQFVNNYKIS